MNWIIKVYAELYEALLLPFGSPPADTKRRDPVVSLRRNISNSNGRFLPAGRP